MVEVKTVRNCCYIQYIALHSHLNSQGKQQCLRATLHPELACVGLRNAPSETTSVVNVSDGLCAHVQIDMATFKKTIVIASNMHIWEVFRLMNYSAQADDNSAHEAATWQHHRQDLPSVPKA